MFYFFIKKNLPNASFSNNFSQVLGMILKIEFDFKQTLLSRNTESKDFMVVFLLHSCWATSMSASSGGAVISQNTREDRHWSSVSSYITWKKHKKRKKTSTFLSPVSFQLAHFASKIQLVRAKTFVWTVSPQWASVLSEGAPDSFFFFFLIKREGLTVWKVVLKQ